MTPAANPWRYGLIALPLAFVALPLYVQLPNYYATQHGMPIAVLGFVLLATRLVDACLDPWIGRASDRLFARSNRAGLAAACTAGAVVAAGFALLLFPPRMSQNGLLVWVSAWLVVTYVAYSVVTVAHQSWGARAASGDAERSRVFAWREGFALAGVLLALLLPAVAGWPATAITLAAAMVAGSFAWWSAKQPVAQAQVATATGFAPLRQRAFRRLLGVFILNGIATAIPATLVLFFVQDRLQAAAWWEPAYLAAYFASGALSLPLWTRGVERFGLARVWMAGIVLAVSAFAGAGLLGAGDTIAFLVVCIVSGIAVGTDLVIPSALLAGIVAKGGQQGQAEGLYFGWWNLAAKWNLALAAGVALPLIGLLGYAPGSRSPQALAALAFAYVVVPCIFKVAAAALLYFYFIRPGASSP